LSSSEGDSESDGNRKKPYRSRRTFDEFIATEGMLPETEELALKEIIADQVRVKHPPRVDQRQSNERGKPSS
jgi:hypothetical protein